MYKYILINILLSFLIQSAYAHSGGTDSKGCHTKRSDGSYHCH